MGTNGISMGSRWFKPCVEKGGNKGIILPVLKRALFAALCEVLGGRSATISVCCRNFAAIFSTAARV